MKRISFTLVFILLMMSLSAQEVLRLYGKNPSEFEIKNEEKISYTPTGEILTISNVVDPSITIYLPDPEIATGTAVVLCPGGAMRFLSWNNDVIKMARFLNEKGIAVVGLKYRLQSGSLQPQVNRNPQNAFGASFNYKVTDFEKFTRANANPSTEPESADAVYKASVDAQEAIRIVRNHAAEWKINPDKVGFLGFSAGGGVATAAAIRNTDKESMPNFIATCFGPSLIDVMVPSNAPPLFICTNADHPNVAAGCLALFLEWKKAGVPAELHIYGKGKAGFSIDKQGQTSDTWSDSFLTWLKTEGF